jgi:lysophospholipase L1-like esterase
MLRKYAVDMYLGNAVGIECFGDSTENGHNGESPFGQVAELPSARMQLLLRDYTNNNLITVTNRAIDGTRLTQMIDGTDGSGSTFAAKMAVSPSLIITLNHGLNDSQNAVPTPPDTYRSYLIQAVKICRAAPIPKVMIFKTPNPIYAVNTSGLGTIDKADRLNYYVQIMKDVAEEMGVVRVDVNEMVDALVTSGNNRVQDIVPDGVHPSQYNYQMIGQLTCRPILHPQPGYAAHQTITAGGGTANQAPYNNGTVAEGTRGGLQLVSVATAVPKSIKLLVMMEDKGGVDVFLSYPIWSGGIASAGCLFDNVSVGPINQTFVNLGSEIIQDQEVCVARNVPYGLHWINVNANVINSIAVNGVRLRPSRTKKQFTLNTGTMDVYRAAACPALTFFGTNADDTILLDELPVSWLLSADNPDILFDGVMTKGTRFVVIGVKSGLLTGVNTLKARMGLGVGTDNATGFVTVYQLTGAGIYGATAVNAADFSLVSRAWRFRIPAGTSNLQVFADGTLLGTVPITVPFKGGLMGVNAVAASKTLAISNLRTINTN